MTHRPPCETPEGHRAETGSTPSRWVLPATILGSSVGFIDGSVVGVALPAMRADLGASLGAMQWVTNGYMLTLASLILLGGAAGDRFGRRRMFTIGLIGFAIASLGCALAPSAAWLIAARLGQGAAAALLTPASLAIIGAAYTGAARGPAIGTWAAAGALTTALGPPLGGWLVDSVGWRTIFFINLPVIAIALLMATRLPKDEAGNAEPVDWAGGALAVATLASASYGLVALGEGQRAMGWGALAAALPAVLLFVWRERRAAAPMMPLTLFASRDFAGANALTVLLYAALGGALFLLPFMLIQVHGYSAAAAGAAFLPFSAIMGLGSRFTGGLPARFGARPPLVAGPAITAAGFVVLALSGDTPDFVTGFLPGLVLVAIGMTIAVPPLTTTVFDSAPPERGGVASGINNAAARAGNLLAVAALGLAFGSASAELGRGELASAYRTVMLAAAALAAASAAIALLVIAPRTPAPR